MYTLLHITHDYTIWNDIIVLIIYTNVNSIHIYKYEQLNYIYKTVSF